MHAGETVSLESVAAAAGISRATAYRAVSGIPDLLASTFAAHATDHVAELNRRINSTENTLDALEVVVTYTVESLQNDPVMAVLFPTVGMPPHDLIYKLASDTVRPIVVRGQERGEIRSDTDAMDTTAWLFDCFARGLKDRNMSQEEARRMYRTYFVPALRPTVTSAEPARSSAAAAHLREALNLLEGS